MKEIIFISILLTFIFSNPVLGQNDSLDVSELVMVNREGLFDSDEILKLVRLINQFPKSSFFIFA